MIGRFLLRLIIAYAVSNLLSGVVVAVWVLIALVAFGDLDRALDQSRSRTLLPTLFGFLVSLIAASVASLASALLRIASPSTVYGRRMFKEAMLSGVIAAVLGVLTGLSLGSTFEKIELPPFILISAAVGIGLVSAIAVRLWAALPPIWVYWRRRSVWVTALGIFIVMFGLLVLAAWPGSSTFTISPETTYITEPLDRQGYVDYVTALNERLRRGVTPESNANVLIWQAIGPHPEGSTMPPEYFQWLGIASPPEVGDYWVSWLNYQKAHPKNNAQGKWDKDDDLLSRAAKLPWHAEEEPELADWLKVNEKPLALVVEATGRPEYYNPLVPKTTGDWSPGMFGAIIPNVQQSREFTAALVCRAMRQVGEGKNDSAWQDLLACHRLARLIGRGSTVVGLLVGFAIDQIADKADIAFLERAQLTSMQVLADLEDLRRLPPMPTLADQIDLGERLTELEVVMLTARHGTAFFESFGDSKGPPPASTQFRARLFTYSIDWNPALKNINVWLDRYVSALRIADLEQRAEELSNLSKEVKALKLRVAATYAIERPFLGPERRGELIGNVMIGLFMPAFEKVQGAADRTEQWKNNVYVAFALAAYQRDHGRYPANLDELAPKYLEKIPEDLFCGKPLIYRLENDGYLLYSVGINGRDEDGQTYGDDPPGDDIVVRIPIPDPPKKN
jgi:hypothetical protein